MTGVPAFDFEKEMERLRDAARARLLARGRPTTGRRISGIIWWDQDDDPPEPFITVGADHPDGPAGDPVLLILESARFDDMYSSPPSASSGRRRTRRRSRWGSGGGWWMPEAPSAGTPAAKPPPEQREEPRKAGLRVAPDLIRG
jgi:hypothetical protein